MADSVRIAAGSTIADVLAAGWLPALEARILLGHALGMTRVQLVTQSARALTADDARALCALFARRRAGEPIAYLTGEREFFGLTFSVTPEVLIPRHETELLVELALERLPKNGSALDLGTGSGAIAVSLAHARPDTALLATDASAAALEVARANAARNGVTLRFALSDWYSNIEGQFDLIVSNPPYIAAGDPHLSQGDLRFEPASALTDDADGLTDLAAIIDGAPSRLHPGGWLLMEHGYDQSSIVRHMLQQEGWTDVQSWPDLAGIERVSGGRWTAAT